VLASGRELFFRMGCGSCHRFADAGSTGTIGPDLDERLAAHDRESLRATILTPPGTGADTFGVMPDNFDERLNARALDALVAYLLAARRGG
jgi:cytochrome c oxidase subunit 2